MSGKRREKSDLFRDQGSTPNRILSQRRSLMGS